MKGRMAALLLVAAMVLTACGGGQGASPSPDSVEAGTEAPSATDEVGAASLASPQEAPELDPLEGPDILGNMAIYRDGRRGDIRLGMPLEQAEEALTAIGYDRSDPDYISWRSGGSTYVSYDAFSYQTLPMGTEGEQRDCLAWIYIKSPDYATNKGLKPGAEWEEALAAYGQPENSLGSVEYGVPAPAWAQEPFARNTAVYDWPRENYYFFAVRRDGLMQGYGIALDSLPRQRRAMEEMWLEDSTLYENKVAGFSLRLPGHWSGYVRAIDDEYGTSFFYGYDDDYGPPPLFAVHVASYGEGDRDGGIDLGTIHGRAYASSHGTDVFLDGLTGWHRDKAEMMLADRQRIGESIREIPVQPEDNLHPDVWMEEYRED